jgi:MFS family permease
LSQALSAAVGVGVGVLVGVILGHPDLDFPRNYALLFTFAAVSMVPSTLALIAFREPPPRQTATDAQPAKNGAMATVAKDPRFRRMLSCRLLVGLMNLAVPFYVGHASGVLHLPEAAIGAFTIAMTVATIVASIALGALSERRGPRLVIQISAVAAAVSPLYALAAHLAGAGSWLAAGYPIVFVALGVVNSSYIVGFANYLLELAPEGLHGAYIGVGNTVLGLMAVTPILGGLLLQATSYTLLFGVTALGILTSFWFALRLEPATAATCAAE